jgi:spermidine dehydrogenase
MTKKDRKLGMDRDITRRDFLNGASIAIGGSLLPHQLLAQDTPAQNLPSYYPPALTGMRGSHPGSFEVGHRVRDGDSFQGVDTNEIYDLVVVGGGISGLTAAYAYRQTHGENSRILVLDNHDDFGGHAKRNEFEIDGKTLIGYGGTMLLSSPGGFPPIAKQLIQELGIETERFYDYFDLDFYNTHGLGEAWFFDQASFGADHLTSADPTDPESLSRSPLSKDARDQLARLFQNEQNYLSDLPEEKVLPYLQDINYLEYLRDQVGLNEEGLKVMLPYARSVWAVNIDVISAANAWSFGYPGFGGLNFPVEADETDNVTEEPNIFHFPDGNATVARLLVKKLIPRISPGNTVEDIITARFDYGQLDQSNSAVRIRLNSSVVRAQHMANNLSNPVSVTYMRGSEAYNVTANQVVMAGYNALVPKLCPEMPEVQKSALANCVRAPLVYTNVLIRNWHSLANLGVRRAYCPGCYHHSLAIDYPVSMGGYQFSQSPDDPVVLHLTRVPGDPGKGVKEQIDAGRRDLLTTSFETFERNIRSQLQDMLSPAGFDAARDIAGITVNRWPHGYAYGYDPESDRLAYEPEKWPAEKRNWELSRHRFGNISIASTDAASNAMTEAAIEQAYRAVEDLN